MGLLSMGAIIDGQANHDASFEEYVAGMITAYARRQRVTVPPLTDVAIDAALDARVDAGRWIAECPDCHDAQYVWTAEAHPLFLCVTCFNATVGRRWRPVLIPSERAAIEAALEPRPMPHNRNWTPGETVADLRAENRQHGIGV